ncbi:ankyrin repeat-containing protein [Anaeramoeba flamelloides]|uniref:Ankyrin repeat-containing protein n=1 Tax=Anaeramoeba flamelloides TaxID=1746091 RepID=A0AAV7Z161_9EUKA|nr:ankyrin repeat-containing protein [Anaeramoeba flamelloides]
MYFWSKKKNIITLLKAPKKVVIDFIKNNCDENPGLPIVELLIRKKYETFWIKFGLEHKGSVTKYSREGHTCLSILITRSKIEENYELIELLLQKGLDPNYNTRGGFNAFHHLCQQPTLPIKFFRLFFKYGANPNTPTNNRRKRSPFYYLLLADHHSLELFKLFHEHKADPVICVHFEFVSCYKVLCTRTRLPEMSVLQFFNDIGHPIKQNADGYSTMALLCSKTLDQEYLDFLLRNGCDINPKLEHRLIARTPLSNSLIHNKIENAKLLLKNGADPNLPSSNSSTPLHCAISKGVFTLDLLKLFLKYDTDLNKQTKRGYTLLTFLFVKYYYAFFPEECRYSERLMINVSGGIENYERYFKN